MFAEKNMGVIFLVFCNFNGKELYMVNGFAVKSVREPRSGIKTKRTFGDWFRKKTKADKIRDFLVGPCFCLFMDRVASLEEVVQLYEKRKVPIRILRDDFILMRNEVEMHKPYTVRFRDSIESVDPIADEPVLVRLYGKTISMRSPGLSERLLFGLEFFKMTKGQHLDNNGMTLCCGTRFTDSESNEFYPAVYLDNECVTCVTFQGVESVGSYSYSRLAVYHL